MRPKAVTDYPLIKLKNGQTYFKNLASFTPPNFKSMFDHFSTLCMKGLIMQLYSNDNFTAY